MVTDNIYKEIRKDKIVITFGKRLRQKLRYRARHAIYVLQ